MQRVISKNLASFSNHFPFMYKSLDQPYKFLWRTRQDVKKFQKWEWNYDYDLASLITLKVTE